MQSDLLNIRQIDLDFQCFGDFLPGYYLQLGESFSCTDHYFLTHVTIRKYYTNHYQLLTQFQKQHSILYNSCKSSKSINKQYKMTLDETYSKEQQKYITKLKKQNNPIKIVDELIRSPNCQSWKILQQVLSMIPKGDRYWDEVVRMMDRRVTEVENFVMLMFLYWWKCSNKMIRFGSSWRNVYRNCLQNGEITLFSTWIESDPNSKIAQSTLQLISSVYSTFFKQQYLTITEQQIDAIIQWVNYLHTPTSELYDNACSLVTLAKESRTLLKDDYVEKEHVILKKLIQVCGKYKDCSSNIFLFMYPFTLNQKHISYFCHTYSDFLNNLEEENLTNFFKSITKSAASPEIIYIIQKISITFKNQQSYCKLRTIYENFILPHLCRRVKACKKVYEQVFNICEYYIVGFLKHCDIGKSGIECVIKNVGKIKNQGVQEKWVQLCNLICTQSPDLREQANRLLTQQFGRPITLNKIIGMESLLEKDIIWNVTMRSGKKLKKYNKTPSKMKGIVNQQNQCYIISVVQALQKGQLLQPFLKECFKRGIQKYGLLNQMRILFDELSEKISEKNICVRYLKNKGPPQFKQSINQEDAYQYLIQLFDMMEKQLKHLPEQLNLFKKFYEVRYKIENTCSLCQNKMEMEEFSYAFSIPHTQILHEVTKQTLPDFYCEKCKQRGQSLMVRKLVPSSKILIVHINRFSHKEGKTRKQLSTQTILREFLQYTLVGMICHLGKNVEHGHYVYYQRVNQKRWAVFNDTVVEQFQLDKEGEEFQRQWKSQITPYILFYQELQEF